MSTAHHTNAGAAPDSMSAGIGRLLIIAFFAGLAALLWYYGGLPLKNKKHGSGHGKAHHACLLINKSVTA